MLKAFFKDAPFGMSVIFIILAIGFVYIAMPVFGNSALIVRSGSMQPAIAVGDLAVVKKQADGNYNTGDIIAFKNANNSKTLTTHRIAGVENKNGQVFYRTKGDANNAVDRELVSAENIVGKAYFRLPYLGKIIAFTKTSAGFSLAVIFPALLVIAFEIQNIFKEIKKQKSVPSEPQKQPEYPVVTPIIEVVNFTGFSNRHKLGFRMPSLKIILPILAGTLLVYSSIAFFSDTETSTNNTFTAADSFGPPIAQTLVINEILPDSNCDLGGDKSAAWIELWNGFSTSINLQDFQLNDGTATVDIVSSSTTLAPNSFALIAKDNSVWTQCYTPAAGAITVNLGNNSPINLSSGVIRLLDENDIVIDRVEFGSGDLNPSPDQSIERVILGQDSALGDTFVASDFSKQCPSTPGSWSVPTGVCTVVINELMWMGSTLSNPTGPDDEWLELRNMTSNPIDLTGWKIEGAVTGSGSFTVTSGTISANGLFLISHFNETTSRINVTPDLVSSSLQLDNDDAQYILRNNLGSIVDIADDDSGAPLAGNSSTKASMERNSAPGDGTLVGNWHTATTTVNFDAGATEKGTPQAAND